MPIFSAYLGFVMQFSSKSIHGNTFASMWNGIQEAANRRQERKTGEKEGKDRKSQEVVEEFEGLEP